MIFELLPALMVGAAAAQWWFARSLIRDLRLSLRREHVAVRSLVTVEELLKRAVTGTLEEGELRLGMQLVHVGWADELHAQTQVGRLTRIPNVGEPWPDSMLASVLDE